jgi:predicted ferric reductase
MSNTQWWYVMRSSGMVAWVLLTLTVLWGAVLSSRLLRSGRRWLTDMHPFLASLGLAMLILHIVAAVVDSYAGVSLTAVFVPFAADWNPVAIALGVVSLWAIGVVQVTSWLRRRMARRTWNLVHQASYGAAWTMALHALTAGTDTRQPWFAIGGTALIVATAVVTVLRAVRDRVHPARLHAGRIG